MTKDILSREFELLKRDLIASYDAKGMRASGNWADQLEVYTDENRAILFGEDYTQQLETGRKAGKFPPLKMIEQWVEDKGILNNLQGNISKSSLVFLIARKIAREGWNRERFGGVDLISEIVTEERVQKIIKEVGEAKLIEFTAEIIFLIKELNEV